MFSVRFKNANKTAKYSFLLTPKLTWMKFNVLLFLKFEVGVPALNWRNKDFKELFKLLKKLLKLILVLELLSHFSIVVLDAGKSLELIALV